MTLGDMDWGDSEWDVDAKAESLNRSLFGRRKANLHQVKADQNLSDKNETGFAIDSDDDEIFSKKAKKKLKERRRMENKKNKTNSVSTDGDVQNVTEEQKDDGGGNKGIVNKKSIVPKSKTSVKKEKNSDTKSASTSELDDTRESVGRSEASVGKGKEKDGVKKKKQKNLTSFEEEGEEIPVKLKKKKTDDKDSNANSEDDPEKKRKRKKKKKPNSKKNKYKHLGLKSRSSQDISESDSEDEKETAQGNKKDNVASKKDSVTSDGLKSTKGKKRKNSMSGEEQLPSKKSKVSDESEKLCVEIKSKKKKKPQKLGETRVTEEEEDKVNEKQKTTKSKAVKKGQTAPPGDKNGKLKIEKEVSKKLKTEKKKKKKNDSISDVSKTDAQNTTKEPTQTSKSSPFFSSSQGSELQQKMVEKLASARFRFINEQLYTIKGGEALRMFQQDKTLMEAYNTGFQGQVKQWSVNPLDVIIKQLSTKPAQLTVVDFGCGEARLSASIPQKVHSFDLFPLNERVTVCDMSKTPLASGSIDVVVFCLSLMGTNLNDYILEANRILKDGGLLKIAEVVSRFTDPNHFINAVSSMGFRAVNTRELSAMFYLMDFKKVRKVEKASKQAKAVSLKPCLYKKR